MAHLCSPAILRWVIKKLIVKIGPDPSLYDTHSLHSGCARHLIKGGCSLSDVRFVGRWWSNTVYRYLIDWKQEWRSNVQQFLHVSVWFIGQSLHPVYFKCFSESVKAIKQVWVIGDKLVADEYRHLQQIKREIVDDVRHRVICLYENYDVQGFFPSKLSWERNHLTKIRNTIVYVLNNNEKMPKHLIVLLYNSFVKLAPNTKIIIKWLVSEIWKILVARFEYLPRRSKPDHPVNILIVKLICSPDTMLGLSNTFMIGVSLTTT